MNHICRKSSKKPPGGLVAKLNCWMGAHVRGEGLFQTLAFSSKVDIINDMMFSINQTKTYKKATIRTNYYSLTIPSLSSKY